MSGPSHPPAPPRPSEGLAALVSPDGRIGPVEFWIGFFVHSWLLHLIGVDQWVRALERGFAPQLGDDLRVGLFVLDLWLLWVHFARRWHDLDMRAAWTVVLLVPGLGWLFAFVMLGFVRGSRRRNRWGSPRSWRRLLDDLHAVVGVLPERLGALRAPTFDGPGRTDDRPAVVPSPEPPTRPESSSPPAAPIRTRPIHRGPLAPPGPPVVVRRRRGLFG